MESQEDRIELCRSNLHGQAQGIRYCHHSDQYFAVMKAQSHAKHKEE